MTSPLAPPVQISVYEDKLYISNDCQFPSGWTAETLMGKHRSCPLNPDVANTFFRAGYIESWGRGIEKICRICRNYGIPEPEYTVHPNDIMLCFMADSQKIQEHGVHTENMQGGVGVGETTQKTTQRIVEIIRVLPCVTISELENKLGKSNGTIKEHLSNLKSRGIIRRVGPDKGGHWEVISESWLDEKTGFAISRRMAYTIRQDSPVGLVTYVRDRCGGVFRHIPCAI